MGQLNAETGAIELSSNNGTQFRMYGDSSSGHYTPTKCFYISGIYGPHLFVYASNLQEAFDIVADDSTEFEGMYMDDSVNETIQKLQDAAGIENPFYADLDDLSAIYQEAEEGTFAVGNHSQRLNSEEWNACEVSREEMFAIRGYDGSKGRVQRNG